MVRGLGVWSEDWVYGPRTGCMVQGLGVWSEDWGRYSLRTGMSGMKTGTRNDDWDPD